MNFQAIRKKINARYDTALEALFASLVTGWFITGLIFKSYSHLDSLSYLQQTSIGRLALVFAGTSLIAGILWFMYRRVLRCLMFAAVFFYCSLAVYTYHESIFFAVGMIAVSLVALLYAKKDLLYYVKKIRMTHTAGFITAIAAGVMLIIFIGVITVLRYRTYSNSTYDFGIFAQVFDNLKQTGHPYTSVEREEFGQISHFGIHFSPIFYLMLPVYFLFSSPVTVQMIQAVVLGVAVIPLYFICRQYRMSPKFCAAICILYCIFPATAAGTYYDFHENCCVPLLLFSLILALERKNNIMTAVCAALLLMVKEEAALYIVLLGVYLIISNRGKKRGALLTAGALVYFVFATAAVQSHGLGSVNDLSSMRYGNVFYDSSKGMTQMAATLLSNPAYYVKEIMNTDKIQYIILMILPVGAALIQRKKHYSRYLLLGTFLLFNVIPGYQYQYDITFQYSFGTVAFFLYIAVMTLSERKSSRRKRQMLISLVAASILFAGYTYPKLNVYLDRNRQEHAVYEAMDNALSVIPNQAAVLTSGFIMPHLYDVDDLHVIREGVEVKEEFVVVDLRPGYSTDMDIVGDRLTSGYSVVAQVDGALAVYQKNVNVQ